MRLKKQKRNRRSVKFYTTCFGFREPFKILCDGTFIHSLLVNKINSPTDAISNALGAKAKLFTTKCIVSELKSLGKSHSESFLAARDLATARCDHEKRISGSACIQDVIGEKNLEHFFVATQDTDLRKIFQEVPGVPLIYGQEKSLFLEPPSESQRRFVRSTEEERLYATEMEYKVLQKQIGELTAKTSSPDSHEDLGSQILMAKNSTKRSAARRMSNVMDKPQFKRKKAKGRVTVAFQFRPTWKPFEGFEGILLGQNPLSCKKKRIKVHGNRTPALNQDGENASRKKRNRKRKRSSEGTKLEE